MQVSPFQEIQIRKPSDDIIVQIKKLISDGVLKPGDKLPPERQLQAQLKVGRGHIREAIKKLEFYGILTTRPQSGTYVSSLGVRSLEGLITNLLEFEQDDFAGLIETRMLLEIQAARLCAERSSDEGLTIIRQQHEAFAKSIKAGESGIEEDLLFHLAISRQCNNRVLNSLISILTPDSIRLAKEHDTCREGRAKEALSEHMAIMTALEDRDADQAAAAMQLHLQHTIEMFKI